MWVQARVLWARYCLPMPMHFVLLPHPWWILMRHCCKYYQEAREIYGSLMPTFGAFFPLTSKEKLLLRAMGLFVSLFSVLGFRRTSFLCKCMRDICGNNRHLPEHCVAEKGTMNVQWWTTTSELVLMPRSHLISIRSERNILRNAAPEPRTICGTVCWAARNGCR